MHGCAEVCVDGEPLFAGREDLKLVSVKVDDKLLDASSYQLTPTTLTISNPPAETFKVSPFPDQFESMNQCTACLIA